jgi:two-component system cell cycle response regulator
VNPALCEIVGYTAEELLATDLQEQLIAAREAMRQQATRDFLTGAWNHRAIMEILARELGRARREGRPLGMALVDLDHFKQVNDSYGHLAGDAALREAVRRMGAAMRPYDFIGRYGEEKFLIVMPGCDQAASLMLANRLRGCIAAEPVCHHDQPIPVTASFGVVVYTPPALAEIHTMLHTADAALYRAKRGGRNRVEVGKIDAADGPFNDGAPSCSSS